MPTRALNKLTARQINAYARTGKPGSRLSDGGGLYATKRATGSVTWTWIGTHDGRRVERGLGSIRDVTLAQARETAAKLRKDGVPQSDVTGPQTFAIAAREYREAFAPTWKTPSTRHEFDRVTTRYCAAIADVPVATLGVKDVLKVMDACDGKPTVQKAALSIMRRVIDREIARGHRSADSINPAASSRIKLIRPIVHKTQHHPAMPYSRVPAFVAKLRVLDTQPARAMELLILTGMRSAEVLGLRWSEVDLDAALVTIPAERMKAGRTHVVPLTRRALAILRLQLDMRIADHVFPGTGTRHLSNNALRVLDTEGYTIHGFRSSLRQFLADRTDTSREVAEGILAHTVLGVEGAYRREASLDKAGAALKAWGDFVNAA